MGPNIYVLSIYNIKIGPDLRLAELGHEEERAHNEVLYTRFHNVRVYSLYHYKPVLLDAQS